MAKARSIEEIVERSLVVLALLMLTFDAPVVEIRRWIEANGLVDALSPWERALLSKDDEARTQQENIDLSWSVETLYALMWIGSLVSRLSPEGGLPDGLADLSPDLEANEDGSKFSGRMCLRSAVELYAMRDLFYVAHWSARDARLSGSLDGPLSEEVVMERRKALEWAMDSTMDWDDVDQST